MVTQHRFLQVNLNRSAMAMALMRKTIEEKNIDLVLAQEPNIKALGTSDIYCDTKQDAVIIVCDIFKSNVSECGKGPGYVWVRIEDTLYYSCYFSPNKSNQQFLCFLDKLQRDIKGKKNTNKMIISGDLNAKSKTWGAKYTDSRGKILEEFIAEAGLWIINVGNRPTFQTERGSSVIDITLATEMVAKEISNWYVDTDSENLSNHNNIFYTRNKQTKRIQEPEKTNSWILNTAGLEKIKKQIAEYWDFPINADLNEKVKYLRETIKKVCNNSLSKTNKSKRRPPVYWWNAEIAELRRTTIKKRREMTKTGRDINIEDRRKQAEVAYKKAKLNLKIAIRKAKSDAWKSLLLEIDEDRWGKGYKIITKKFRKCTPIPDEETEEAQIKKLFPSKPQITWDEPEYTEQQPNFTVEELKEALSKCKNKKAPGPDGIKIEIIKAVAEGNYHLLLDCINSLWQKGAFPTEWKIAKLVLIEKPMKPEMQNKEFRPICLLNNISKLYERLIKTRLENEIRENGDLSEQQYGFRCGKSTLDAIKYVMQRAEETNKVGYKNRGFCLLVTLDISNAFNSARWEIIVEELINKKIGSHLIKVIQKYLTNRKIRTSRGRVQEITCGVPQGSVLGPILWNVLYDRILKIKCPKGTSLVAFADDLAVVVCAKSEIEMQEKAKDAIQLVKNELDKMDLTLNLEKTDAVLLSGRRKLPELKIKISENFYVKTQKKIKYLGLVIDKDLRMAAHVDHVVSHAEKTAVAIMRLMPNIGGPGDTTRRIYATVAKSVIMYAAPLWMKVWKTKIYKEKLERLNRRLAIRVARAYRTVRHSAVLVIAGLPPLELLAIEKEDIEKGKSKEMSRRDLLTNWQARWNEERCWTKELINNIEPWINRGHGELNYNLSMVLTGHGTFNTYRKRIKKDETGLCWFCEEDVKDTLEHTVFECKRFKEKRLELNTKIKDSISKENMTNMMIKSEKNWNDINKYINDIMDVKREKERSIERKK
ncbi:hypothetical protein Zmor_004373 [Zophobas morio]|uniref:Reverse transcriptase domain-containing protein n=1 Tax=Zophobas morio TaxID=2755281 RepID=A0AA38HKU3_9CUCU|nr:hypothetical protein Zmor_004373 [Zophobas morio]